MDSPGSPLSDLSSDEFLQEKTEDHQSVASAEYHDSPQSRPSKRQRTGGGGANPVDMRHGVADRRASAFGSGALGNMIYPPTGDETDVSEDTEGSMPASPTHHGAGGARGAGGGAAKADAGGEGDEDSFGHEQVTVCKWEGCEAGDVGNMDKLVEHLHYEHIGTRQKKYSCEWVDCSRKGIPHASGYALRAHMRSHTREKPFYCTLPECDRAFTRSDALAKHMRTVHETEALRPSDPVPKHHSANPSNKLQRIRLVFNKNSAAGDAAGDKSSMPVSPSQPSGPVESEYDHNNVTYVADGTGYKLKFPSDIHFTDEEARLSPDQLFQLLRRQLHWAQQDGEDLKAEIEELEKRRKEEWFAKELLLENVLEAEEAAIIRREEDREREDLKAALERDVEPSKKLKIKGDERLWWRHAREGVENDGDRMEGVVRSA
ncbi:hypothetical protein BDY21DRAFT_418783 [Lineolata rhizophorae]|uniref:C2H2-type domain-containing protein n=1 Tax=Lineolata rhizophorae TaxID=578093 RepID=A0A6A6PA68_9PEZI|nr:hypothetical protein BDY21DRAFT_418783 [Lineolata rhizophorae]